MSTKGALVYVVDDDLSAREGLANLVSSVVLNAKTFASGLDFLGSTRPEVPSCLVLDVNLPGISGLEVQQELARSGVEIPIIFLTGYGNIPVTVRAVKAGAANFLTKPVNDEELLNAIRQFISVSGKEQLRDAAHFEEITGSSKAQSCVRQTLKASISRPSSIWRKSYSAARALTSMNTRARRSGMEKAATDLMASWDQAGLFAECWIKVGRWRLSTPRFLFKGKRVPAKSSSQTLFTHTATAAIAPLLS
jgi:FixJ family two-component response regulator